MTLFRGLSFHKGRIQHDNYKIALAEFNKSLSLIIDPEQLRANVVSKIQDIIKANRIFLFLYNDDYHRYMLTDVIGVDKSPYSKFFFTPKDKLIYWLLVNEKHLSLVRNEGVRAFFAPQEQNMLTEMNVLYIHPLKVMNRLTGLICLGQKYDGSDYNIEEIELLSILLDQAAIAFENANMYQNQKERMKKMYRADRLAIMGQLAAGAAHEIRNPLAAIRSTIQYVKKEIKDPVKAKMTTGLLDEVDRINAIIQGLLSFSSPDRLNPEIVDLKQLINQTILLISNTAKKKNCEINIDYKTERKELIADPSRLKQVFLNIIMNALDAVNKKGVLNIVIDWNEKIEKGFEKPVPEYIITFTDNGRGISSEDMEKIFDPFFTTKEEGTGLGLSISYGIVVSHGGDILVESRPGKGTKVVVKLPVKEAQSTEHGAQGKKV